MDVAGAFGRRLHDGGLPVSAERMIRFAEAVVTVRPSSTAELYWVARITLVSDRLQIEAFDHIFRAVFNSVADIAANRGDMNAPPPPPPPPLARRDRRDAPPSRRQPLPVDPAATSSPSGTPTAQDGDDPDDSESPPQLVMSSSAERLAARDFGACTTEELDRIRALVVTLRLAAPLRSSHRTRPHRRGSTIDLRATLRNAQRTGGDPYRVARRRTSLRPRRVVLLADVSGSMEPYARAYLTFLHGAVRALRAEAFVFATGLTRLTRPLRRVDPDVALTMAMHATPDWSGGTRLGAALAAFNDGWGRRGLARGAVVVIVSDGWTGDDPSVVAREMQRLSRIAYRVVWVNPRLQSEQYRPLVGGMAAALPHIDRFVSGHSLIAMQAVAEAIGS